MFAALIDDSNSQWLVCRASCQLAGFEIAGSQLAAGLEIASWQLALLAFIYGSAVMAIVIVALMKSARKRRADAQKKR